MQGELSKNPGAGSALDSDSRGVPVVVSRLFDVEWYSKQYPDVAATGLDPLSHYMASGSKQGREPNAFFHTPFYRRQLTERGIASTNNAFLHYLTEGAELGLRPHPLFEPSFYRECYALSTESAVWPYEFFMTVGLQREDNPTPLFESSYYRIRSSELAGDGQGITLPPLLHYLANWDHQTIDPHALFDVSWYISHARLSSSSGYDPLSDYLEYGCKAGLFPNPLFDSEWYLNEYVDVSESGVDPLTDFVLSGWSIGRFPNALFDPEWYVENNSDLRDSQMNPLTHYIHFGALERRNPGPLFDTAWYLLQVPDGEWIENPLSHFLWKGSKKGLNPHPMFDSYFYARENTQEVATDQVPIAHYVRCGIQEGRKHNGLFTA